MLPPVLSAQCMLCAEHAASCFCMLTPSALRWLMSCSFASAEKQTSILVCGLRCTLQSSAWVNPLLACYSKLCSSLHILCSQVKAYLADPSAFASSAPAESSDAPAASEEKEEKKEEEEEESDEDMGFSLFD